MHNMNECLLQTVFNVAAASGHLSGFSAQVFSIRDTHVWWMLSEI